jgi:hypothetical protein
VILVRILILKSGFEDEVLYYKQLILIRLKNLATTTGVSKNKKINSEFLTKNANLKNFVVEGCSWKTETTFFI